MKKILLTVTIALLAVFVFLSIFPEESEYESEISRAEEIEVEIGLVLDTKLLEDQVIEIKELLTNADWKKTKNDLSSTHHMRFDNNLLVSILDASGNELMIEIDGQKFILSDVESNIYSIIFNVTEYKSEINRAETITVEKGLDSRIDLSPELSEDQVIAIKEFLTNADWIITDNDSAIAETDRLWFGNNLMLNILDVSGNELMIAVDRYKFILSGEESKLYSIIDNK